MRKVMLLASFTGFLVLAGCVVPSVQPLYTEEDQIFDPALLGTWAKDRGETWKFDYAEDCETNQGVDTKCKGYELVVTDPYSRLGDGEKGEFVAHLVMVDGVRFLDLYPHEMSFPCNDLYMVHLLGVHTFWRVYQVEPGLKLACFTSGSDENRMGWLGNLLKTNPTAIGHAETEDGIVLTAAPKELQKFLLAHLQEGFGEVAEFERQSQQDEETGAE